MDIKQKKEFAVSEVVGVLLMLTVTIIMVSIVAVVVSGSVGESDTPTTANIVATDVAGGNITMELQSGDPIPLNTSQVRIGIRENASAYVILRNTGDAAYLVSYTGSPVIELGDRFRIAGIRGAEGITFDSLLVPFGNHLTYRFYDLEGKPFSAGEILVK